MTLNSVMTADARRPCGIAELFVSRNIILIDTRRQTAVSCPELWVLES